MAEDEKEGKVPDHPCAREGGLAHFRGHSCPQPQREEANTEIHEDGQPRPETLQNQTKTQLPWFVTFIEGSLLSKSRGGETSSESESEGLP